MKLAVNGQMWGYAHSFPVVLEKTLAVGLKRIEIWPHNLAGGESPLDGERYGRKDLKAAKALLTGSKISAACVTVGFQVLPLALKEGGEDLAVKIYEETLEAAAFFGAPVVNSYFAGAPASAALPVYRRAAKKAESLGIILALENEAHDDSAEAKSVAEFLDRVGSPHVKALFDPCNFYQAGCSPYPEAYETLGSRIGYVHLKGGLLEAEGPGIHKGGTALGRQDKFIGYLDLSKSGFAIAPFLDRLKKDAYQGGVTLEPHVPAADFGSFIQRDLNYLAPWVKP